MKAVTPLDTLIKYMRQSAQMDYREAVRMFRQRFIVAALKDSVNGNGRPNQCKAAKALGMHRNTLCRLIVELGIELPGPPQVRRVRPYAVKVDGRRKLNLA